MRESIEVIQPDRVTTKQTIYCPTRLLTNLGLLSSLGILSGGMALAQTTLEIPTSLNPTAPAPAPAAAQASAPSPAVIASPERFSPESVNPEPSTVRSTAVIDPKLIPALTNPTSVPKTKAVIPSPQANSSTEGYEAPTSVIFSERSTGCELSLGQGQNLTQGLCSQQPALNPPGTVSSQANVRHLGNPAPVAAASSNAPVHAGSFGFSSAGISVTLPSIKPYFNRGSRPLGRPGNGNVSLLFPLAIPASITSLFGWRTHPISGDSRFHSGTDLGAPMGTPVLAALTGKVALADFLGGYGLAVALDHSKGSQQTLYAHLSEIFVRPGEWVKQGAVIGRVGSTGASTGPHLHFEFRQLTTDGWVAQDAGFALEQALAQLVQALQVAQVPGQLPAQSGQPLPQVGQQARSNSATKDRLAQAKQIKELAKQLALAAQQANQPLQPTAYDPQKLPIGRIASVGVAD